MKPLHMGLVLIIALMLDQASKWGVLTVLDLPARGTLVVVPGFLNFALAWNTGVNFGLFSSSSELVRWLLIALAVAVSVALMWWVRRDADGRRGLGAGLIAAGALGNALDRIVHGAVVDFLNISAFGFDNPFSFNMADVWVFAGAALLMMSSDQEPMSVQTGTTPPEGSPARR